MALLSSNLKRELPNLHLNRDPKTAQVHARFHAPKEKISWLVTEGSPDGDDFEFYGCVVSDAPRWGYFSLAELREAMKMGTRIVRDRLFTKRPIAVCLN